MEIPVSGVTVVLVSEEVIEEITEMCELEEDMSALVFRQSGKSREIELFLYATQEQVRDIESKSLRKRPNPAVPVQFAIPQASLDSLKAAVLKAVSDTLPPAYLSEEHKAVLETRISEETNAAINTLKATYDAALQRMSAESQQALDELQSRLKKTNMEVMDTLVQLRESQGLMHSVFEELESMAKNMPDVKEMKSIQEKIAEYEFSNREVMRHIASQPKPKPKPKSLPLTVTNLKDSENQAEDCYIISLRNARNSPIEGVTLVIQGQTPERRELATGLQVVPGDSEVKVHLPEEVTGQLKLFATKVVSNPLIVELHDSKSVEAAAPVSAEVAKPGALPKPNFNKVQPIGKPMYEMRESKSEDSKKAEERKVEEPKPAEIRPSFPVAAKGAAKFGPKPFTFRRNPEDGGDTRPALVSTGPTAPEPLSKSGEEAAPVQTELAAMPKPVFKPSGLKPPGPSPAFKQGPKSTFASPILGRSATSPVLTEEVSLPKSGKELVPQSPIEAKPVPVPSSPDQPQQGSHSLPPSSTTVVEAKPSAQAEAPPAARPKPFFPTAFKSSLPVSKPSVPGNSAESPRLSPPVFADKPTSLAGETQSKPGLEFKPKPFNPTLKPFVSPAFKPTSSAMQPESSTDTPPPVPKPAPQSNSSEEAKSVAEDQPPSSGEQSQRSFRPVPLQSMPPSGSADKPATAPTAEAKPGSRPFPVPKFAVSKPNFAPKPGATPFKPPASQSNDPPSQPPQNDAKPPLPELTPEQQAKIASVREVVGEGFTSDMERKLSDLLRSPKGQFLTPSDLLNEAFT